MYTSQGTLDRRSAIERYGPMVRRVAAQMVAKLPSNVEMDDLVQAGMIGLMDAMTRYEASQGAQFETFAMQRVRGAMLDELRGGDWMPRSVRKNQRAIEQAVRALEHKLKRAPTEAEIARQMNLPLAEYQSMLADARGGQLVYLDELNGEGEDGFLDRHVAADEREGPGHALQDARFRGALVEAIGNLPERERFLMAMYYEQDMNLKEIGAVLGVTESRVCQLHSQAVARLRAQLRDW